MADTATEYLRILSERMLRIEANDRRGSALGLDGGAREAVDLLLSAKSRQRKALVIGNGGSAAIADHLHNDLCKTVGIRALVFTDTPLLTALSNDNGYPTAFQWSVEFWAEPGDLLIAISSSGESQSILGAARAAAAKKCGIVTLSGFQPENQLRQLGDVNFYVPAAAYGYVEMAHAALVHFITDCSAQLQGQTLLPSAIDYK